MALDKNHLAPIESRRGLPRAIDDLISPAFSTAIDKNRFSHLTFAFHPAVR
jgi:hypothetical protein